MPDKKPTDAEIIKALEYCCKNGYCKNCSHSCLNNGNIEELALDLINRQQAEVDNYKQIAEHQQSVSMERGFEIKRLKEKIESLQAENEQLTKDKENFAYSFANAVGQKMTVKAEAYKECIEKVKEEIKQALESNYKARNEREKKEINLYLDDLFWNYCSGKIDCLRGLDDFLDELLKELVGDK